jgi:cell division septum initiation protein DivIVA
MAKTGPLGDVEKFYLENKHQEFTVEQLAKKLNRPKGTVEKYINKARSETVKTQEEKPNLFASRKGSTVMTQAASELGDEIKKQNRQKKPSAKCTTNIR